MANASDTNTTAGGTTSAEFSSTPYSTTVTITTMTPYPSEKVPNDSGMGPGAMAGIVIGAITVIIIITGVAVFMLYRRKKLKAERTRERKPEEMPPSAYDLEKMDSEKLKTKKGSGKSKKSRSKRKRTYEPDPTSVISVDPSSMPSFMAPEPPSESYENESFSPGYENLKKQSVTTKYINQEDDYLQAKADTKKIYSSTEGAEYYVVDKEDELRQKQKQQKFKYAKKNTSNLSESFGNDYENLRNKPKNPRDFHNDSVDDPQDVYEPMES